MSSVATIQPSTTVTSRRPALPTFLLFSAILFYILIIGFLQQWRLTHFMDGFDLAFYQQAIWNTAHGHFLAVSATDFSSSLLGTDVILIYVLMSPFYWLVPNPMTLLLLETVVIAAGALPVYWLARRQLKNDWLALGLAVSYLLLPAVQNGNLYELRERMMGGAFLLFAFYGWYTKRFSLFLVAAGLALACRPENGLVLIMLGGFGWLTGRQRSSGWRDVLAPIILGAIWFGSALVIISQFAKGGYALGSTFAGGSPVAAITTVFTNPGQGWQQLFPTPEAFWGKLLYVPLLLLPFGFLPLRRPAVLLLALPSVGLNLLAGKGRDLQWNAFDYHYQAAVLPWLIVATIFAIESLQPLTVESPDKPKRFQVRGKWLVAGVLGLTLLVNVGTNLLSLTSVEVAGLPQVKNGWARTLTVKTQDRWEAGKQLLKQIPDDAPLAISNVWADQVPPRTGLWYFAERPLYSMHPTQDAQYIFADLHSADDAALVQKVTADGSWQEVGRQADYVLLRLDTRN